MTNETIVLTEALAAYLRSVSVREPEILVRLRAETRDGPMPECQVSPEQGALMAMLVELMGARRTLEVGVFTGYSSLAVALALPDDGEITACDYKESWTATARRYWAEAGVAHKIDLRIAPAIETLPKLLEEGRAGTYDFAFLDADKGNCDSYYELCLELLRPGGLVAIDNVLLDGAVLDTSGRSNDVELVRALNQKIYDDERVSACMVPVSDGLMLARKRG